MSFVSGLRKFKPGNMTHIRHASRAYALVALIGAVGVVLLLLLRGAVMDAEVPGR